MYRKLYSLLLSCSIITTSYAGSTQLMDHEVQIPTKLGNISVIHKNKHFFIHKDGEEFNVQDAYIDNILHNLSSKQLKNYLGRQEIRRYKLYTTMADAEQDGLNIKDFELLNEEETAAFISEYFNNPEPAHYIQVSQTEDGEYILHAKTRLVGGGVFGAWLGCWVGKAAVHVGGQGLLTLCMLPLYFTAGPLITAPIHKGLASTIAPALEATSIAVGCAVGIAGAVATGPV